MVGKVMVTKETATAQGGAQPYDGRMNDSTIICVLHSHMIKCASDIDMYTL